MAVLVRLLRLRNQWPKPEGSFHGGEDHRYLLGVLKSSFTAAQVIHVSVIAFTAGPSTQQQQHARGIHVVSVDSVAPKKPILNRLGTLSSDIHL